MLRSDGTLNDASEIIWHFNVDDDKPLPAATAAPNPINPTVAAVPNTCVINHDSIHLTHQEGLDLPSKEIRSTGSQDHIQIWHPPNDCHMHLPTIC
jgi:hypothetical protein